LIINNKILVNYAKIINPKLVTIEKQSQSLKKNLPNASTLLMHSQLIKERKNLYKNFVEYINSIDALPTCLKKEKFSAIGTCRS